VRRAPWDLTACGVDGHGPFRLELHYANGSITEYFHDVATAFRAIEDSEKHPGVNPAAVVPGRLMIEIPDDVDLVKQCFSEDAWASGARH
jgi:hypothetical protein